MKAVTRAVLCLAAGSAAVMAQTVISARSGMIHYLEGKVFLGGQAVESKFGNFPEVKENATLRTEQGRAEVLLNPGVFLRVGETSSFRMVTSRLVDTRVEFLSGSMVIEADEILKDNAVTVAYKDASIKLAKKGLYRFDANPPALRVFDGDALVSAGDRSIEVKDGKMLTLDGNLATAKFDKNGTDALDRWSRRRGEYVAMANVAAANSLRRSGGSWNSSGWAWNPWLGMFSFVPYSGSFMSPYGYRFWSPGAVYEVYVPRPVYSGGGPGGMGTYNSAVGYNTMSHTSSGYSGTMAAAPAAVAPAAPSGASASAPVSRGGGNAGGARR